MDNRMRPIACFVTFGLMAATGVGLGDPAAAQIGIVPPRALTQPQPPLPRNVSDLPIEGWATVRFSVLADGTTSDVRVIEIVPPVVDPGPTIEAVERWTFDPGSRGGEPVDWHNTEGVVVFELADGSASPSESFVERYDGIRQLLESGSFEEALAETESLLDQSTSHPEVGLALAQQAIAYVGLADLHSALVRLRQASDPRIPTLPGSELLSVLQLRFQIEVQLGRRSEALATYQRIVHALGSESANPYQAIADQLAVERETIDALPVQARVSEVPWRTAVGRRTFTIADVEGMVRGIGIECDFRATQLPFQPDQEISLPTSWGACELFIDADPGTSFVYYEFLDVQDGSR